MQVQRENLEKENGSLKADLEQLYGLQEQYEQLQEKVSKCILIHMKHACWWYIFQSYVSYEFATFQERAATENVNSLTQRLEQKTAK